MYKIALDVNGIMRQAPMTVEHYYLDLAESLDRAYGEGYAKKNPELMGRLVQAAASDYAATLAAKLIGEFGDDLTGRLDDLGRDIDKFGRALERTAAALEGESNGL